MRAAVLGLFVLTGCTAVFGIESTDLVGRSPRTLTFDNRAAKQDLVDLPIPIRLDASRIEYAKVRDVATDLRFVDPVTGDDVPFEVERWDPDGSSLVWIRAPLIHAGSTDDRILMYYGEDAHGAPDAAGLWRDYALVMHGQPGAFQSAATPVTADVQAVTTGTGPLDANMKLAPGDHYVTLGGTEGLLGGWPSWTLELWMYADYPSSDMLGGEPRMIDLYGPVTNGRLTRLPSPVPSYVQLQLDLGFTKATNYSPTAVALQRWLHVVYTCNSDVLWIFVNGVAVNISSDLDGDVLVAADDALTLGSRNGNAMAGMLDEVRISSRFSTEDMVAAQYLAANGGFVTFVDATEQ